MNGTVNPNTNKMGNFGRGKNYMASNEKKEDGVSINDILAMQHDPTKQKKDKWRQQSEQQYEQKQRQIAAEQANFIPDTFKDTHMKKITQNTQSQPKMNSNTNNINYQPKRINNNNKSKPINNKPQQNQMNNNRNNKKPKPINNKPQQNQIVREPYYDKPKPDPFDKYLNNSAYQKDLKNNMNNIQASKPAPQVQQFQPQAQFQSQPPQQQQQQPQPQVLPSNNSNQFAQASRPLMCTKCGGKIIDSWTEDSRQRVYHNECFVCSECGISLGSLGKYVTVSGGILCRPCRNKQTINAQNNNNNY